jgi:hypothetical protein
MRGLVPVSPPPLPEYLRLPTMGVS